MRNVSLRTIFMMVPFVILSAAAQTDPIEAAPLLVIQSAGSGNWSDSGTWVGGVVPDSTDDVVIDIGHTVTVDAPARCHDLSFADDTGRLAMEADLSLYGDFNRFDTSVNPFFSGGNLWQAGAKMIFTGDQAVQTINNLGTTSASPYPCRFQEIVIDKPAGKFTTNPVDGTEADYKLGIGTSLDVVNGAFELGLLDDIEGRTTSGTASTPTITVHANGFFQMLGSFSHIRRGNFTGEETSKVGKMTVYGEVWLACATSNRINITDIDVEDGGLLRIPFYSAGGSMGAGRLNPGTITIKDGGRFLNSLNTDLWYTNTTTPTQMAVLAGGTVEANSSAPVYPALSVNQGTFLYSRSSSDQAVFDMDYYHLELSNSSSGSLKTWNLAADRAVADELEVNNGANLVLTADAPVVLTVGNSLRMTSGSIDNSDPDVAMTLADEVTVNRATGTLSNAPEFAGVVDVRYLSSVASVTTGPELPTAPDVLRDLQIWSSGQTVTLGADAQVNGTLTLSNGDFDNDGASGTVTLTLADGAVIRRGSGSLTAAPDFAGTVDVDYISTLTAVTTGPELPTAAGVLADLTVSGDQGVTLGAEVTVNGACTISGSDLVTGAYAVILAPTATLVEADSLTVLGQVMTTRTVSQSVNETFGDIGLEIEAAGAAPGITQVVRTTNTVLSVNGEPSILRYFDVTPTTNAGLDAAIVFHYDESELNGIVESGLTLFSSFDDGASWMSMASARDDGANTVSGSGVDTFDRLTLANEEPVPTRLASFHVQVLDAGIAVSWTLSETSTRQVFAVRRQSGGEGEYMDVDAEITSTGRMSYQVIDNTTASGAQYRYRVDVRDETGTHYLFETELITAPTLRVALLQNAPNPFSPATTITYSLPIAGPVTLEVYDIAGRLVRRLVDREETAGEHHVDWAGMDQSGRRAAPGVYFYRLVTEQSVQTKKMSLLK